MTASPREVGDNGNDGGELWNAEDDSDGLRSNGVDSFEQVNEGDEAVTTSYSPGLGAARNSGERRRPI